MTRCETTLIFTLNIEFKVTGMELPTMKIDLNIIEKYRKIAKINTQPELRDKPNNVKYIL